MNRARKTARLAGIVALVTLSLFTGRASANGRYPLAFQLAFGPADANHFILSTTFGLVESRDGGKTFNWICEPALQLSGTLDESVAITENDVVAVTSTESAFTSTDGCSFLNAIGLTSGMPPDMSLSHSAPRELFAFTANILPAERFDSQVMHSSDEGRTWTAAGPPLPDDVLPLTIDVAPSDGRRIYLSARLGSVESYVSVVLRSDDGGASFVRAGTIPGTAGLKFAYIAAVHPTNADFVYVRIADLNGTVVLLSEDGGATFKSLFTGTGPLLGFAVSNDQLALGGPSDGLWIGNVNGEGLARRFDIGPSCLAYRPDGLYACADSRKDGFSIGRLPSSGATFEPILKFATLCGAAACGPDTQVGTICPAVWPEVAPRLGATCGTASSGSGAGDAAGRPPADAATRTSGGEDGGSCSMHRGGSTKSEGALGIVALLFVARRTGRQRARRLLAPAFPARGPASSDAPARPASGAPPLPPGALSVRRRARWCAFASVKIGSILRSRSRLGSPCLRIGRLRSLQCARTSLDVRVHGGRSHTQTRQPMRRRCGPLFLVCSSARRVRSRMTRLGLCWSFAAAAHAVTLVGCGGGGGDVFR